MAAGLLEATFPCKAGRIILFTNGPPTQGPGAIAGTSSKDSVRTHTDLQQKTDCARFHAGAVAFYAQLAARCVQHRRVLDIFKMRSTFNEIGVKEMLCCCNKTGGVVVLNQSAFRDSLGKMFECGEDGHLKMGFAATLKVLTTPNLQQWP